MQVWQNTITQLKLPISLCNNNTVTAHNTNQTSSTIILHFDRKDGGRAFSIFIVNPCSLRKLEFKKKNTPNKSKSMIPPIFLLISCLEPRGPSLPPVRMAGTCSPGTVCHLCDANLVNARDWNSSNVYWPNGLWGFELFSKTLHQGRASKAYGPSACSWSIFYLGGSSKKPEICSCCTISEPYLKNFEFLIRVAEMNGKGYGMPSSHAQFVTYFSLFLSLFLLFRHTPRPSQNHTPFTLAQRIILSILALLCAAAVSASRIYLNYHTAKQVLVGCAAGALSAGAWFVFTMLIRSGGLIEWVLETKGARMLRMRDLVVEEDLPEAGWERWEERRRRTRITEFNGDMEKKTR